MLVHEHQHDVRGEEGHQDRRDEQHVHRVQPRDDRLARERTVEHQIDDVRADDRDRAHEAFHGADPGAGEQVVREGVPHEALEQGQ